MIVVDASVVVNALVDDTASGEVCRRALREGGELVAPDLLDVEVVAVLRRFWLTGVLPARRFAVAVDDLMDLDIMRYPPRLLLRRVYELRANVTAYDATYVALAEVLSAELVTSDQRLASAPGPKCPIHVLTVVNG